MTLFQRTLKIVASQYKCGNTLPKKLIIPFLGQKNSKKGILEI
jgi:hypothetical protein